MIRQFKVSKAGSFSRVSTEILRAINSFGYHRINRIIVHSPMCLAFARSAGCWANRSHRVFIPQNSLSPPVVMVSWQLLRTMGVDLKCKGISIISKTKKYDEVGLTNKRTKQSNLVNLSISITLIFNDSAAVQFQCAVLLLYFVNAAGFQKLCGSFAKRKT